MLVTFTCEKHENVVFFGTVAMQFLHWMGHSGTVPGAILAKDVPEALARLQQAILSEKEKPAIFLGDDDEPNISLAHRVLPLIALLQNAVKEKCNVMWH
jgi:hypothetical protein